MTAFITHYFKKLSLLFWLITCTITLVQAETIANSRAEAEITADGQLLVSTRFQVKLPPALNQALEQGVIIPFSLAFRLNRPRSTAYYLNIREWFEPHAQINFRLSYQPLTSRYRLTIGNFSNYYTTLREALAATGAIQGWRALPPRTLNPRKVSEVAAEVRLALDISALPRPFQLNALGSNDWSLSSDWVSLNIKDGS